MEKTLFAGDGKRGFGRCYDIFARERAGDSPQNDVTYFIRGNEGFKIANWGAAKTPLDMFLSKYILKDGGYVKNISERFMD